MADNTLAELQHATHSTVVEGPGHTDPGLRQHVASGSAPPELASLIAKIRDHAYRVTDADVDALRAKYTEDQLFEIIVAAALGAAEHRLTRALAVVEEA
jgi:alkylhydroperoxidase family enzyme